jgi:hypothetical protein
VASNKKGVEIARRAEFGTGIVADYRSVLAAEASCMRFLAREGDRNAG